MAGRPQTCYRHPRNETRVRCTRCDRPICPECMTAAPVGHHCPECVARARSETRRVRAAFRRPRSVTAVLLGANVVVFGVELVLGGATDLGVLVSLGAMVPLLVAGGEYWRLLTTMFLHVGVVHLAFNALGLYIFGSLVEGIMGSRAFVAVYVASGLFAGAASFAFGDPATVAAGASGAIFGLLGAWLAYNLRRRSLSLAQANVRGALLLIGINLALGFTIPGIDNVAHLGGLAAGIVAGVSVEGFGPPPARGIARVAGFASLLGGTAVLVAWRAAQLAPFLRPLP